MRGGTSEGGSDMTTARQGVVAILIVAAVCAQAGAASAGPPTAVQRAQAAELRAQGRADACLADVAAREALGQAADPSRCLERLQAAMDRVTAILGNRGRFIDNGDGTITDLHTGLMWERQDVCVPFLHCADLVASWPSAMAAIAFYNGTSNGEVLQDDGFAGHFDWRIPNVLELESIVELDAPGCGAGAPCIDPVFGPTGAGAYWTSTSEPLGLGIWTVDFASGEHRLENGGGPDSLFPSPPLRFRAVRNVP